MEWNSKSNQKLDWQEIVKNAKLRRKEEKISQKKLAAICGISAPTVSHFENGKKNIQISTAIAILKALGLAK